MSYCYPYRWEDEEELVVDQNVVGGVTAVAGTQALLDGTLSEAAKVLISVIHVNANVLPLLRGAAPRSHIDTINWNRKENIYKFSVVSEFTQGFTKRPNFLFVSI